MPEKSAVEKVFIGIGRATHEIAHKQEQGVLWVINKHIVPHLSPEWQKKAKANKARIELFAKRAGIGLTAAEIISATILSAKALQFFRDKLIKNKPKRGESTPSITPVEHEFWVDPYASTLEQITKPVTRARQKAAQIVKEAVLFEKTKPTIRKFVPETFPVATEFIPETLTKVFEAGGGATDFVSHQSHYLFSGNDQYDHDISKNAITAMATFQTGVPMIHMDYLGRIGKAVRLTESQFKWGRNNRPFWHSEILRPIVYNDLIQGLERGLPALSKSIDKPITMLATTQQHADEIAAILSQTPQPWNTIGHGFDNRSPGVNIHTIADQWLNTQQYFRASLQNGRHLWDDENEKFRTESLPRLASLLDAAITDIQYKHANTLFVLSPSHHLVPGWRAPEQDALFMQSWYAFFMPLFRKLKSIEPDAPFIFKLPGFSTSPVLGRAIRFFIPSEQNGLKSFSASHTFIYDTPQTPRAIKFLSILIDSITVDRLDSINNWRERVFSDPAILAT